MTFALHRREIRRTSPSTPPRPCQALAPTRLRPALSTPSLPPRAAQTGPAPGHQPITKLHHPLLKTSTIYNRTTPRRYFSDHHFWGSTTKAVNCNFPIFPLRRLLQPRHRLHPRAPSTSTTKPRRRRQSRTAVGRTVMLPGRLPAQASPRQITHRQHRCLIHSPHIDRLSPAPANCSFLPPLLLPPAQ